MAGTVASTSDSSADCEIVTDELVLPGLTFEPGDGTVTRTITGHLDADAPDSCYLPVEVPRGVNQLAVSYSYNTPALPAGTPGNSCDIGVFDERGIELGGPGFRGWSGGVRTAFTDQRERRHPRLPARPGQHGHLAHACWARTRSRRRSA